MYKIYGQDNYIVVVNLKTNSTHYGHKKEVFIDKSNIGNTKYRIFKVRDLKDGTILEIGKLQKEDGSLYTEQEFDTFYQGNTGNFNGGGTVGSATEAKQDIANTYLDNIDDKLPALVGGKLPVTLGSDSITITGSVNVGSTVEITNEEGSPIPVSGNVVADTGLEQPLTNAELRATPVNVSVANEVEVKNDSGNPLLVSGAIVQEVTGTLSGDFASNFSFNVAGGDFINTSRSSNGQQFVEISIDPLSAGEAQTIVEFKNPIQFPLYSEIEASLSQRTSGDYVVMEITDKVSLDTEPIEYNIVSITQATTTLTVVLDNPFDGWLGSWVDIYGLADSRFNYTNAAIATMSLDKKTLTITTRDEVTLPSLSVTPSATGGKLKRQAKLQNARNAVGMRFTGTSTTASAFMSRFDGGSIKEAGTLTGARLATIASTAPTYISGANGQVEIKATSRYRIEVEPEIITFMDKSIDSASTTYAARQAFTAVKPSSDIDYYIRFRAVSPRSISRPVAKIVSAVKATASTTATITTDVPHGLTTSSWVNIYGIANQTVFANLTAATQVASIIDATTFTIVIGTATIATSYGGYVSVVNGGITQQGAVAQVVQSVAVDANGFVTLVGNGTWAGLGGVGEYVNLLGVINSTNGADLGVDGVYRVSNFTTTTLVLEPVKYLNGIRAINGLGQNLSPTVGVITTTNAGGALITRTTLRSHDFVVASYSQSVINISGQGTQRADKAIPIIGIGGGMTANQGNPATINATTGLGGWYTHPAVTGIVDVASAAITSTSTGSAIANNLGNAFEVVCVFTAGSGTTPTFDLRIEESFDGGTNWHTLYEFERFTGTTGVIKSPMLRANGRHIRYIQTVGGTSPSFTRAITRNIFPSHNADKIARLFDRSVSLTTLNATTAALFAGSCSNAQLVVNLGAATTAPVFKLQGSEDNSTWYDLSATTLTGVASSTVQLTLANINAPYIRGIVSTAGVGSTLGYVSLKAWS